MQNTIKYPHFSILINETKSESPSLIPTRKRHINSQHQNKYHQVSEVFRQTSH